MIDSGVDAKTVSERLGNSVATVLTTYTRARTAADRYHLTCGDEIRRTLLGRTLLDDEEEAAAG